MGAVAALLLLDDLLQREALSDWPKADLKTEMDRHYGPYWQGLDVATQATFAKMLREMASLTSSTMHKANLSQRISTTCSPRATSTTLMGTDQPANS